MRANFTERMERAKALIVRRGGTVGGKNYQQGRIAKRRPADAEPAKDSWERFAEVQRLTFRAVSGDAQEDYRRAAYPERYLKIEIEDFT